MLPIITTQLASLDCNAGISNISTTNFAQTVTTNNPLAAGGPVSPNNQAGPGWATPSGGSSPISASSSTVTPTWAVAAVGLAILYFFFQRAN